MIIIKNIKRNKGIVRIIIEIIKSNKGIIIKILKEKIRIIKRIIMKSIETLINPKKMILIQEEIKIGMVIKILVIIIITIIN
jgi:hypothetical protein